MPWTKTWDNQKILANARKALMSSDKALGYLKSRGFVSATIDAVEMGYIPDDESGLARQFPTSWRNRIICPIYDTAPHSKTVMGFSGRILPEFQTDCSAKWLNTKNGVDGFDKSKSVFMLNRATFGSDGFVCEGCFDAAAVLQKFGSSSNRFPVCTLSKNMTEDQAAELRSRFARLTLCYDNDEAGQQGVADAIPNLIKSGFSPKEIRILCINGEAKDVEDALNNGVPMTTITVQEWARRKQASEEDKNWAGYLVDALTGVKTKAKPKSKKAPEMEQRAEVRWPSKTDAGTDSRLTEDERNALNAIPIVDVIGWLGLPTVTKFGRLELDSCPNPEHGDTPVSGGGKGGVVVNVGTNNIHCFSCGKTMRPLDLAAAVTGDSFPVTVKNLADFGNIPIGGVERMRYPEIVIPERVLCAAGKTNREVSDMMFQSPLQAFLALRKGLKEKAESYSEICPALTWDDAIKEIKNRTEEIELSLRFVDTSLRSVRMPRKEAKLRTT